MECGGQENNLNLPLHVPIQHQQTGPLQKGRGPLNLFDYYFQSHGDAQITQSKTMRNIPEIYREAALIITSDLHNGNYNAQNN